VDDFNIDIVAVLKPVVCIKVKFRVGGHGYSFGGLIVAKAQLMNCNLFLYAEILGGALQFTLYFKPVVS